MAGGDTNTVAFAKLIIKHPYKVIVSMILLVMAIGYGAQFLQFSTNYRVFFSGENPQLSAFDSLERIYAKTDNILFTIKPNQGNAFSPEVLALVQEMTEESWRLPYAQRVDSLTNFQHTYAIEDDLIVEDLVEGDPASLSPAQLLNIQEIALNEPLLVGRTVSQDGVTTGINVTVNLTREDMFEVPKTAAAARELVDLMRAKYPDIEIRPSGMVFMNNAFMEASMQDMGTIIPIMYIVLLVAMVVFLRSILATIATTFVIVFSAMTAMGFGGWVGFPMTPPTSTVPTIVMTLAIADSIHIIVSMLAAMRTGMGRQEAIVESIRINMQPVFLTSLTTMIGFLALNFSEAPPFWHLGNMAAFGVFMAFILSVTFLPALLTILPIKVSDKLKQGQKTAMDKFGDMVVAKRVPLLTISLIAVVVLGSMIPKIEINDQFVEYFDYSVDFRPDTEFMVKNLTGIYNVEYALGSSGPSDISSPVYLQAISDYTDWLRSQPEVLHVYSLSDIFKRLNKNMHADDPAWYKLPDNQDLAAQYLLLYELSLPYGLDLNDRVNIDKSATRISVTLDNMSTNEIRAFKTKSEEWLKNNTPEYMHTEATSPVVMFAFISMRNIDSMTKGNILSLFLISICIMIALRSFKIGVFSLIPNIVPIILGYGLWAVFVGQVNMAVAISAAVSLGIIVDDSVHFLSKYMRARREKGATSEEAVRYAFSTVGTALVVTTFILMAGFGLLSQSTFQMNSYLGLLTMIVIGSALFADFFLLPPLLMLIDKGSYNMTHKKSSISGMGSAAVIALIVTAIAFVANDALAKKTAAEILSSGDAASQGEAIAIEMDDRDIGFGDQTSTMTMTLTNAYGQENTRSMRNQTLELPDRSVGDKSIIVFDSPADVKGTALLSYAQILEQDQQWLFLPALKRVKRISSKNKSGPFVGSEFAYEDITGNEIGKYSWSFVELSACNVDGQELECFKLDSRPKYEHSGYTKRYVWIDTAEFRPIKVEYYDRKDELLKVQTFEQYKQYLDQYWRAHVWKMDNVQTGKHTTLNFNDYTFNNNLTDKDFTKAVLKRVK